MSPLDFDAGILKEEVFKKIEDYLQDIDLQIVTSDKERPWGGFIVIDESQASKFINHFFNNLRDTDINLNNKLSPKFLVVAPHKRLSWQYHYRRAEIWKLIGGSGAINTSLNDEQKDVRQLIKGEVVLLKQGERHRLIGTEMWGVIAEIWQHTDNALPSDENDIVRLQDDYGR